MRLQGLRHCVIEKPPLILLGRPDLHRQLADRYPTGHLLQGDPRQRLFKIAPIHHHFEILRLGRKKSCWYSPKRHEFNALCCWPTISSTRTIVLIRGRRRPLWLRQLGERILVPTGVLCPAECAERQTGASLHEQTALGNVAIPTPQSRKRRHAQHGFYAWDTGRGCFLVLLLLIWV